MANTINDNQKEAKQDWFDCPEPSKDFNQTVKETKVNPNSAVYTRQRPKDEEYFRCYDPSGVGDITKIKRYVIVNMIVKGKPTPFLCVGPEDFYEKVRNDFGKVTVIRPAMYETSNGRVDIWPVKEPKENQNGNVNAWNATANDILEKSLTQWVRSVSNQELGYYDGYLCNDEKAAALAEEGKPEFKEDYKNVLQKAYQGFILTPDTYDSDPHVQEFVGAKMNTVVKDEKGKKIN